MNDVAVVVRLAEADFYLEQTHYPQGSVNASLPCFWSVTDETQCHLNKVENGIDHGQNVAR